MIISADIPDTWGEALDAEAIACIVKRSQVIRWALADYLRKRGKIDVQEIDLPLLTTDESESELSIR